MKLVNLRVDEKKWSDLVAIAKAKGMTASDVCRNMIDDFIKKNENVLVGLNIKDGEKYIIFSNLEGSFKEYEVILNKNELDNLRKELWLEYVRDEDKIDFKDLFELQKPIFAVRKLVKKIFGDDWGIIKNGSGVFKLIENNNIYNSFNAFVFDKNGELIEGKAYDLALIKSSLKDS